MLKSQETNEQKWRNQETHDSSSCQRQQRATLSPGFLGIQERKWGSSGNVPVLKSRGMLTRRAVHYSSAPAHLRPTLQCLALESTFLCVINDNKPPATLHESLLYTFSRDQDTFYFYSLCRHTQRYQRGEKYTHLSRGFLAATTAMRQNRLTPVSVENIFCPSLRARLCANFMHRAYQATWGRLNIL